MKRIIFYAKTKTDDRDFGTVVHTMDYEPSKVPTAIGFGVEVKFGLQLYRVVGIRWDYTYNEIYVYLLALCEAHGYPMPAVPPVQHLY